MAGKNTIYQWRRKELYWDIALIAPQYLLYVTLTIIPFLSAIPIIFTDQASFIDNSVDFIGLRNFFAIFQHPIVDDFLPALGRSIRFTLLNYAMVWIFGMTLALFMYEMSNKLREAFFTIIYMPYIISGLGIGMLIMMLFSKDTGSLNLVLVKIGIIKETIDIKEPNISSWMLPLVVGWRYAGFNMAIFLSGLLTIPDSTIDAAKVDGTNYFQRLTHVYFPQIVPSIVMATILCMIGSFGVFDELVGMGAFYGNRSVSFLSIVLYRMGFGVQTGVGASAGRFSEALTISFVVYIPLLIAAFSLTRMQRRLANT